MKNIVVLGANGRVSTAAAKAFHAAGHRVIAVSRSGDASGLPEGVVQRSADALDQDNLIRATEDADIIFNGLNPPYTRWKSDVMVLGHNVMAAARHHGATHLFPGNVYNYGRAIPQVVDDETGFESTTRKGALRIELEALFKEQAERHGVRSVILRAGDFYGGTKGGNWFDLVLAAKLRKRKLVYPGPVDLPHAWAYLPDLASSFVAVTDHLDTLGDFESYLFPGHTLTGLEMKELCETAAGHSVTMSGFPWPIVNIGGLVVPMWREIAEMGYLWSTSHQLNGGRLEALLGHVPRTDPRLAMRNALTDLGLLPGLDSRQELAMAA